MSRDLQGSSEERVVTVINLHQVGLNIPGALELYETACTSQDPAAAAFSLGLPPRACKYGAALEHGEFLRIMDQQKRSPDHLILSCILLGYLHSHESESLEAMERSVEYYCAFARRFASTRMASNFLYMPDLNKCSPDAKTRITQTWKDILTSDRLAARALKNAAFVGGILQDDELVTLAVERLRAYPEDDEVLFLRFQCAKKELSTCVARGDLDAFNSRWKIAWEIAQRSSAASHADHLASLARIALDAGAVDKAKTAATTALTLARGLRRREDETHFGHTVLGLIALRGGDISLACLHLLESAAVEWSPSLSSFGLSKELAQGLLEHDRNCVVEYLKQVMQIEKANRSTIQDWISRIESGQDVEFD